jgi:hypothetical protein
MGRGLGEVGWATSDISGSASATQKAWETNHPPAVGSSGSAEVFERMGQTPDGVWSNKASLLNPSIQWDKKQQELKTIATAACTSLPYN